jgi:tetratricopeptide (TPR) repeat protein
MFNALWRRDRLSRMAKPVLQEFLDNLPRTIDQGVALQRAGKLDEAERIYARILKSVPDQFETLQLMAQLKLGLGKAAEAHRLMLSALAARPKSATALVLLGHILRALKRDDDALARFEQALELEPAHMDALGLRGDVLLARQRGAEALRCFDQILQATPDHLGARASRGVALAMLDRTEEALAEFDAVLARAPQQVMALYNRGNALASMERYVEALAAFDRVVMLAPQHALAWNNRGNALSALKRHAEAIASFTKAIALRPDYADAHFNQSLALLASGDYGRGFSGYEWRWKRTGMPGQRRNYGRPLWLGEFPLARKTILVYAEQGLGDTIQFARYVPLLARAGAKVILEVPAELKSLLSRVAGVTAIVARGEALPAFDVQCSLGSLPLAFKTELASVPADVPYLTANEDRVARWRPRLAALELPRIALAWAGNASHANDRNRSIALSQLRPLLEVDMARFVSVQRELRGSDADELNRIPGLLHLGDALADLDDTAAVIALCDLTICVDTAVAHVSAAMGKPTWVLLPFSPDWRWTLDRECSPWYPAVRLFRQTQLGDWSGVIARVREEVNRLSGA